MSQPNSTHSLESISLNISNLGQLDGNVSFETTTIGKPITVHVSERQKILEPQPRRPPVRKTLVRHAILSQSMALPSIMNINPRSIYNKTEDFKLLIEQYEADCIMMSESWEREDFSLKQLLNLENYEIITNVHQRDAVGGKPAILIKTENYVVTNLCPKVITVPTGVEAAWALIVPKVKNSKNKIKFIALCSVYFSAKFTKKKEFYDHIAVSYNILMSKYGKSLQICIAGDFNRLGLSPILSLSPDFRQMVKVPTRLNPPAVLDQIITTMGKFYSDPVTKPPVRNDEGNGVQSDHLIVLMEPISKLVECQTRSYQIIEYRPLTDSGIQLFGQWLSDQTWDAIYSTQDCDKKAQIFQEMLVAEFQKVFPPKTIKVCQEDKPWFSKSLKILDRKRKREFSKNHKSDKWQKLNEEFKQKCVAEKADYYSKIVHDLKVSNPSQWYSKVKRMSGHEDNKSATESIEELFEKDENAQREAIADHYAKISSQYKPVEKSDFHEFLLKHKNEKPPNIGPYKIVKVIKKMNKNAATLPNDIPMKLINYFSDDLALPLCHIVNSCLKSGKYPAIWKCEIVTPVPKVKVPEKLDQLRKISGLLNFSKITDSILTEFIVADMSMLSDKAQYGNVKGVSVQHYLIKMIHQILLKVDKTSQSGSFAVILNMIDWSQAFDRISHRHGIQSFIDNGVRPSLIPVLVNYFQGRSMQVKWNKGISTPRPLPGGTPQGDTLGILEFNSQTNNNTDFLTNEEKFKYIDDLSILELVNLFMSNMQLYNAKQQVPSDIGTEHQFIPGDCLKSQEYLKKLEEWTKEHQGKLNTKKSNYMIFNFSKEKQFKTRLYLENSLLDQVKETRLLGVIISDNLKWHSNTDSLVKRCYQRMIILRNLYSFNVPTRELVNIYCLYIRSVAEQSCVVWGSSITLGEDNDLERIQKVALRIILKENYITYNHALSITSLQTLKSRRILLMKRFAVKCTKNSFTENMFPLNPSTANTRNREKYIVTKGKTDRLTKSAIPTMQRLLNKMKTNK